MIATVATTYGAFLIGGLVAVCLSGIVGAQSYIYFKLYPEDSRSVKRTVAVVWIVDVLHTVFICIGLWHEFVVEYGDFAAVDNIPWAFAMTVVCTAIISLIVQCFFTFRIYKFSKCNWYLVIPILFLNVIRFGAAIASATEMIHLGRFSVYRKHAKWLATFGLTLSSGVDIIVTMSLCYYLRVSRFESLTLKPVLDALFLYTFEAGALTCVSTFITMIFWVTMPYNLVFMGLHFLIAKAFGNTLLVTLNTRQALQKRRTNAVGGLPMTSADFDFRKSGNDAGKRLPQHDSFILSKQHRFQPPPQAYSPSSTEVMIPSPIL